MHDRNGTKLQPGDIVTLPMRVIACHGENDFCNVDLVSVHAMPGYERSDDEERRNGLVFLCAVNTRQVVLVERPGKTETDEC